MIKIKEEEEDGCCKSKSEKENKTFISETAQIKEVEKEI